MAEHRKYLSLQNRDITASIKTAPQDMSDGEKLLRHILEPYKGKLVLLDVWGTWCSPCKKALAHSKEEFERLAPYDVVYLYMANSSPEESWKNIIKLYDLVGDNIAHYRLPAAQQSATKEVCRYNMLTGKYEPKQRYDYQYTSDGFNVERHLWNADRACFDRADSTRHGSAAATPLPSPATAHR